MMFFAMLLSIKHVYLLVVITSYVPSAAQIDAECFTDSLGRDYRGNVSTTNTGKMCQRWTSQSPHVHDRTPSNYPDAGLGDHNYCRNPIGYSGGAYCFTTDSNVRYEECDIGKWQVTCDRGMECFTDYIGRDYRGTVSTTNTGKTCQRWTSQSPRSHEYTPSNYPDAGLGDHNYCRNPDDWEYGAWCYTTDSNERYEKCDIGAWQVTCDRADGCQADYTPFQDSCYKLHNEIRTRAGAKGVCEPQGHLADITSSKENKFVKRLLYRSDTEDAWFGLRKTDVLRWSDGTPLVAMEWHDIKNDGERNCFRIDEYSEDGYIFYRWNDKFCNEVYRFVCEREAEPSRTSSSSVPSRTFPTSSISPTVRTEYSGGSESTAQYSSNLLQTSPITTSSHPAGAADELRSGSAGLIVGGVVGLIVVIALISFILFIIYRRKNRETTPPSPKLEFDGPYDITLQGTNEPPKSTHPGSSRPRGTSHPHQAYEPQSAIGGNDNDDKYYDVKDQSEEYAYAYAEGQNNNRHQKSDDQTYTYADLGSGSLPPAPSAEPFEISQDEGWKKNSIYATSDGDMNGLSAANDDAMKQGEGWVDNSIYGDD